MILLRPIRLCILCFALLVCCHPVAAQQAKNPLLEMIGKRCCDYFDEYETLCESLFSGDSLARAELVRLFSEAGAADPTGEWALDHRRIAGHVRFYDSRKGGFVPSAGYTAEMFTEDLLGIAREAEERGFRVMRLRALFNAAAVCRIFAHDYEQAFACYLETARGVADMPLAEFPWKFFLYLEIGDFYFSFREYEDAAHFYRLIAEDPEATFKNNHRLYPALNGLGMCYRYAADYSKSDSCFLRILRLVAPSEAERYVWDGIAGGNIGINYYLRGDYRRALEWMVPALDRMKRPNDDGYTSRLAADIANIYLLQGDSRSAKKYLDIALDYHRRTRLPAKSSHLLGVQTRYHTMWGDRRAAAATLDSTLRAKEREQQAYSGLVLRRVEQQLRAADSKLHEERLATEKTRSRNYRHATFFIAGALALITVLLCLVSFYYRRTHMAYRELVRKSQQWAGVVTAEPSPAEEDDIPPIQSAVEHDNPEEEAPGTAEPVTPVTPETIADDKLLPAESDRNIMADIEKLMVQEELYKLPDLSLDTLVERIGLNRCYVSAALNRCTGKNFSTYINEYRVKEAIRLMSESSRANLTIEAIGYESGFNDRSNFYRMFKKITGLSPTDFRKNITRG